MMFLILLAAAAAHAAPIDQQLPFLPVPKNSSSFFDASHAAAALSRFQSVIGGVEVATQHKDILRSISAAQQHDLPELRQDLNQEKMATRMEGTVVDRPSIVDINKPIAEYLYGADIMVSPEQMKSMTASTDVGGQEIRHKRGAPVVASRRWPKTQPIAFIFNDDIDEPTRQLIRVVTQNIEANTCLSFKENAAVGSQLEFHRGGGCWSYIGNAVNGKQPISIDYGCNTKGVISHELFHALGIDHTQNRKDRDSYVTINTAAVDPDNLHNFLKLKDDANNNFGVPYDYGSDLHYGAFDFSINDQAVIVANDPDYASTMGQRKLLTFNDYKMANALYECSAKCPKQLPCQNGGYTSPKDCNVCVCNDFFTGDNCETPRINMPITDSAKTIFHQDYNVTLLNSGNDYNWEMFGKDPVKIIKAPEGKNIRVTITQLHAMNGRLQCFTKCPFVGLEFVDNANGDLSTMGKIFCCKKDEGFSFVSKSNVVGYKAYAAPGMAVDATVTYSVV